MRSKTFFSIIVFLSAVILMISCASKGSVKQDDKIINGPEKEAKSKMPAGPSYSMRSCEEDALYAGAVRDHDYIDPVFLFNDREKYKNYGENQRLSPLVQAASTFSIDVDTASYSNARRFLQKFGQMPPEDSIRIEEFINYFDYDYPIPDSMPFSIYHEIAPSPFDKDRLLLHIGIQGKKIPIDKRPASNLVFLIDVSGSMESDDKLGLLRSSMMLLTDQLRSDDTISIAVYAGAAGAVLGPTSGADKSKIKNALKSLTAGGSTAGSEGIMLAYELAEKSFIKGGINRVILATDGDFNVGMTNFEDLIKLIETKRESGIALTALGFGTGNYNDRLMEQLADKGNGNYFYIDTFNEARKVLAEELGATLQTIAKDVKIQIEFNPKYVSSYRLIGYENRKLKKEDFDNDAVDAGEIGAGHTVTALYEITLANSPKAKDGSRYLKESEELKNKIKESDTKFAGEIAFFRLRYKNPGEDKSSLIEKPIAVSDIGKIDPSDNFLFSAGVAYFAQILRKSEFAEDYGYDDVLKVLRSVKIRDNWGYREELKGLVETAKALGS